MLNRAALRLDYIHTNIANRSHFTPTNKTATAHSIIHLSCFGGSHTTCCYRGTTKVACMKITKMTESIKVENMYTRYNSSTQKHHSGTCARSQRMMPRFPPLGTQKVRARAHVFRSRLAVRSTRITSSADNTKRRTHKQNTYRHECMYTRTSRTPRLRAQLNSPSGMMVLREKKDSRRNTPRTLTRITHLPPISSPSATFHRTWPNPSSPRSTPPHPRGVGEP